MGNPRKIELPFVSYGPNKAIFNFEKPISSEQRNKVRRIAMTLNQATLHKVLDWEESLIDGKWQKLVSDATIEKPST